MMEENLRNTQIQLMDEDVVEYCIKDISDCSSYNLRPYNSLYTKAQNTNNIHVNVLKAQPVIKVM